MTAWRPPAALAILATVLLSQPALAQSWQVDTVAAGLSQLTAAAFGPDGRLYVAELPGRIRIYTLGADHKATAVQTVNVINTDPTGYAWAVLGLAFNPLDPPDSVRLYVSRTRIYQVSPYFLGRVTKLTGPNFNTPVEIITGLPVARNDHGNNGILFGRDGNLYIDQGGTTNAGLPGPGLNGNRDESPLSGAMLIAYVNRPGFDGKITYDTPLDPGVCNQTGGFDVEVFAPGLRNPYDLVQHSNGFLYSTDNGPNSYFANGMLVGCDSVGPDLTTSDEVDLIERGNYYGHPNRNRARFDPRQCVFRSPSQAPGVGYTQPISIVTSSTDGLLEYRADNWGGALRGNLIASRYEGEIYRLVLSADGRSVVSQTAPFPIADCLDMVQGPDGTLYGVRFSHGDILLLAPVDPGPPSGPHILSMWPDAGPVTAGRMAKLRGTRLGITPPLSVKLGGIPATVAGFDANSVTIQIPASASGGWRDAYIQTLEGADTLTRAYCYVKPNLADGDHAPPSLETSAPEHRYYDAEPPSFAITMHDRFGVDSLMVRVGTGTWQTLVGGSPDTSATVTYTLPYSTWLAAAAGPPQTLTLYARDDAHNLTMDTWTWYKGLPAGPSARINCGGGGYSSSQGLWFSPDSGYDAGHPVITTAAIAGTPDPLLYQDARAGDGQVPEVDYGVTLPSRVYALRFHFAEIESAYACPGCRVFDVLAEGGGVIKGVDLSSAGSFVGVTRAGEALVADGHLDISFQPDDQPPLVAAWEAWPLGNDDATPPVIADLPEPSGVVWDNPPTVTLDANDPDDGEIFGFYYQVDGGAWWPCADHLAKKTYKQPWTLPSAVFQDLSVGTHTLRIRVMDLAAHADTAATWSFGRSALVGVDPMQTDGAGPLTLWPNPSRSGLLGLRFALPRSGLAEVRLFDLAGRVVHRQPLGWRPAGRTQLDLDLRDAALPPGLYFVRLTAPGLERVERLALVR